ncbi:MAG TPA: VOC family protein, partial [Xanthomonadales bacterium]|nr:VOC family protein [Xanthomonadales bacterium]
ASKNLDIRWSDYSNGRDDPRGIVDDMIFVVVADCHGERLYHTGLPFGEEPYMRHGVRQVQVSAGLLRPGEPYSMFVEFPHVVDSVMAGNAPGFTSYATATYLDMKTTGVAVGTCPARQPPMDTGQTDRMQVAIEPAGMTARQLFDEHYTMLYYKELGPAARFYGEVLGLERAYEDDWVQLYRTTANSLIGVVKEGPGAFHTVQAQNAVMVSLVTADVDALYERILKHPEVEIIKPLQDNVSAPIRAFIMRDPGGYTVEVFQWLKAAE